ncbi:MAG TPA: AAA family ATPase [Dehalococcoidia bacterium]|nr:AAA family ATPase [Dehalococcoidia bacterium]
MSQLPEPVKALLKPQAYPEATGKIELVQTQMSFVFLTEEFVYKVKKAVDLGYLDYTTLGKRRFYCQQEVKLNRRLCPEVYLGVVPITRDKGAISVEGRGEAIEYAVKMRRLPQEAMMETLLDSNRVSGEMISRVAQKLAAFHQKAETSAKISAFGQLKTIRQNTDENFDQTEKYIGKTISEESYRHIKDYTDSFIRDNAALFQKRTEEGRIRDCHGDLHAAHVCFTDGICIYDCIEFNERFRYCDVASEVAFLAMDLDHHGRADLAHAFVNAYLAESQDKELAKLLAFYKGYRAYVRGKVESFKLDDPYIAKEEKARTLATAKSYFDLARAYTRARPMLFITVGLVGTGKTTLAQALAGRLGLAVISSDVTRKQLAGIPVTEHRFDEFDSGIYSAEFTRQTYDKMLSEAKSILGAGGPVILDASFTKAEERLKAKGLAEEMGADFFIIECTLDEETIKERLKKRLHRETTSDGRWEIYQSQKPVFEPVVEASPPKHVIIDTSRPIEESVRRVLDKVY